MSKTSALVAAAWLVTCALTCGCASKDSKSGMGGAASPPRTAVGGSGGALAPNNAGAARVTSGNGGTTGSRSTTAPVGSAGMMSHGSGAR
jgi:hypothetical protein